MRNRLERIVCIAHFIGHLLQILGLVLLIPLVVVFIRWGKAGDGFTTMLAFIVPAVLCYICGIFLRRSFTHGNLDTAGSMLMCALGWIFVSAFGALPFVLGIKSNYLNAYFEAMSGFTTTGITVFSGLDEMPYSILFWRSLTQWLGGLGILSFFLIVTFRTGVAHHIFGAESHKIASGRPKPGLYNTLSVLWGIYILFTVASIFALVLEKMSFFDAVCHSFTALSTGGFSPHDASIEYYRMNAHLNFRLIEYTLTFFMLLGGVNFLIHYRVLTGDIKALWDNIEIRYWWRLILIFAGIILIDHFRQAGMPGALQTDHGAFNWPALEEAFRNTIFQVVSVLTTTGFGTKDIGSDFFGAVSRQMFLIMMVIGGCVGSTGGGFKVMRVAILNRLIFREVFKARVSPRASSELVIDGKPVGDDEVRRVAALFFSWLIFLLLGGGITALFSNHDALASMSGMFSALGNIGPCYISVQQMIEISPVVKITYIVGMLAGRLEILPVLLLFSRRAWR